MLIPIGDEPNTRAFPLVNYLLIAANIAVFVFVSLPLSTEAPDLHDPVVRQYIRYLAARLPDMPLSEIVAQTSSYAVFTFTHGFKPAEPHVRDLLASLFLHANWLHLLGNMLFLWIFGDNVEARLGHFRYLLAYFATGVAATLFFALFARDSMAPLIGASGAISGVLGAYFLWFPQNRVRLLVVLFVFVDIWRVPARWVLAFYLLVDNLLPFLVGGGDGVAYGAHLGGFLAGLVLALVVGRPRIPKRGNPEQNGDVWVIDHGR